MAEREVGGTLSYCPSLAITPNPGSRGQQEEERAGWLTVQSLGGGRQSQLHKYKRGRDMLACLPMHTEPAPPHNGITPSPMTWHSLLTVYNTGRHSPSTAHSAQDPGAGCFAAYQLQALPALPLLLQSWVFPAGTSLPLLQSLEIGV